MVAIKKSITALCVCFLAFLCAGCSSDTQMFKSARYNPLCGDVFGQMMAGRTDGWKLPEASASESKEKPSVEPVYFSGNPEEVLYQKIELSKKNRYWRETRDFVEHVQGVTDIDNYDYLFRTHEVYYTKEDFEKCPEVVLKLAKNEIYARHGRMFLDEELYEYFLTRMWYEPTYTPEEFDDSCLNDCEWANLELLLKLGA